MKKFVTILCVVVLSLAFALPALADARSDYMQADKALEDCMSNCMHNNSVADSFEQRVKLCDETVCRSLRDRARSAWRNLCNADRQHCEQCGNQCNQAEKVCLKNAKTDIDFMKCQAARGKCKEDCLLGN